MKLRFLALALSNYLVQAWRSPRSFFAKVLVRFGQTPIQSKYGFTSIGGQQERDFDVNIFPASPGKWNGRVLHVLTNSLPYSKGGYALRSQAILKAQLDLGIVATGITRLGYPLDIGRLPKLQEESVENVRYRRSLPTFFPVSFRRQIQKHAEFIASVAREERVSVLHTTTPWPNAAATSLAAQQLGLPWVYEVRGEPESTWVAAQRDTQRTLNSRYYRSSRAKETEAMHAAAAVIALSQASSTEIRSRGVNTPIWVIPNSVDSSWGQLRQSKQAARNRLGLSQNRYVGAVSSIVGYEGFDTLILALHHLPEDICVLLVGDGSELPALRRLAASEGLEERVVFAGRQEREEIHLWYSALDVFVVPRKESRLTRTVTPMKTLQARAFGIPIVASDLPALREAAGGSASFVHSEAPDAFAAAILDVLEAGALAATSGSVPTWGDAAREYLSVYSNL